MKNKKKAFTLVELLAVIVILAVILVIAIPQIMNVIKAARLSSIKDSAMLIAEQAEKDYISQQVLNKDYSETSIPCTDVAKLNDDYASCSISYNNGIATVKLKGKDGGKFSGITCTGTKDNMCCTTEGEEATCTPGESSGGEGNNSKTLQIGDYFSFVPDTHEFEIDTNLTGYTSKQKIYPDELTLWRVIDVYDNGSVDAISEYTSSNVIYLKGKTGYMNIVKVLQDLASSYSKNGLTLNAREIGYDGQTNQLSSTQPPSATCTSNSPTTGTGVEYNKCGDTLYLKDYKLVGDVYKSNATKYGTTGLKAYKVNSETSAVYWLASRLFKFPGSRESGGSARYISDTGILSNSSLYYDVNGSVTSYSPGYYLRPIVTIVPNYTISSGQGTIGDPYTFSLN